MCRRPSNTFWESRCEKLKQPKQIDQRQTGLAMRSSAFACAEKAVVPHGKQNERGVRILGRFCWRYDREMLHNGMSRVALVRLAFAWMLAFATSPVFGAPQVFWGSDPVQPGEAAMLIGDGFGDSPVIDVMRLGDDSATDSAALESAGADRRVPILQASDQSVKFVVPEDYEEGVYRVRITSDKGATGWFLNKPTVYWAQGDQGRQASPGGWIRVFGRNVGQPKAMVCYL